MTINNGDPITLGTVALVLFGFVVAFLVERFKKQVNARLDDAEADRKDFQREQVEDAIDAMEGQALMMDSLRGILQHLITGDHISDLERMQDKLEKYSDASTKRQREKAAKWNIKR